MAGAQTIAALAGRGAPVKREIGGKTRELHGQRSKIACFSCFYDSPRRNDGLFRESLGNKRREGVTYPVSRSGFINYRISQSGVENGASSTQASSEIGIRFQNWLLESESIYTSTLQKNQTVRLMSNITYDRREDFQRLVIGDLNTSSGELGSILNLGGIGFSKTYSMDPYFIRQPVAGLTGTVSSPTQADIYIDGLKVKTETLPPGLFRLDQLNYYGGVRDVQIVLKDALGRQEVLSYRYYFANNILKEGLQEYSYNFGRLRENFGLVSNDYGPWITSLYHRWGITNSLTLGIRLEASMQRSNSGIESAMKLGSWGTLGMQIAQSLDRDQGAGKAQLIRYSYQDHGFSLRASNLRQTDNYLPVWVSPLLDRTLSQRLAGIGYGTRTLGALDLSQSITETLSGTRTRATTLNYSRSLPGNLNLFINLTQISGSNPDHQLMIGLSWFPSLNKNSGFSYSSQKGTTTEELQFSQNTPVGEGWGYRIQATRNQSNSSNSERIFPYIQYNSQYGTYSAQYLTENQKGGTSNASYEISAAGAITYLDGTLNLSRPIYDSFAVVDLDGIQNIGVTQNNQSIGKTNQEGKIILPRINSYVDNEVSIIDTDIPIEYSLKDKSRYISPSPRSGTLIKFPISKINAVMGKIVFNRNGTINSADLQPATLFISGKPTQFPIGQGGDFYLENIPSGKHPGEIKVDQEICRFSFEVPRNNEAFIELGTINCIFN